MGDNYALPHFFYIFSYPAFFICCNLHMCSTQWPSRSLNDMSIDSLPLLLHAPPTTTVHLVRRYQVPNIASTPTIETIASQPSSVKRDMQIKRVQRNLMVTCYCGSNWAPYKEWNRMTTRPISGNDEEAARVELWINYANQLPSDKLVKINNIEMNIPSMSADGSLKIQQRVKG